jgi:hypothetical protein
MRSLTLLRDNWPVLAGFVAVVLFVGETRWQVNALKADKEVDTAQALVLTKHEGRLVKLEAFIANNFSNLEQDKRHWGAILDQWPKRLTQLDDHERRLIQIETLRGSPVGGE